MPSRRSSRTSLGTRRPSHTGMGAVVAVTSQIHTEPFTDTYTVHEQIGRGKFANVKKCTNKASGLVYAAKFLRKRRKGKDCRTEILQEITMLEICKYHDRIVDIVEVFETTNELILVTDYACGGELYQCVVSEDYLAEVEVQRLMRQLLEALKFLHDKNIVHLDVKPQNILLTSSLPQGDLKLCDFGFARLITDDVDTLDIAGTPDYVAPEVLSYEPIQTAADIWSSGVVAYVLLTGYSPFASDNKQQTFLNISQCNLDFPEDLFEHVSTEAQEFITMLLNKNPDDRPQAYECLAHPWLSTVDDPPDLNDTLTSVISVQSSENNANISSPIGSRRALAPSSPNGSEELLEPSKRCRCESASPEPQPQTSRSTSSDTSMTSSTDADIIDTAETSFMTSEDRDSTPQNMDISESPLSSLSSQYSTAQSSWQSDQLECMAQLANQVTTSQSDNSVKSHDTPSQSEVNIKSHDTEHSYTENNEEGTSQLESSPCQSCQPCNQQHCCDESCDNPCHVESTKDTHTKHSQSESPAQSKCNKMSCDTENFHRKHQNQLIIEIDSCPPYHDTAATTISCDQKDMPAFCQSKTCFTKDSPTCITQCKQSRFRLETIPSIDIPDTPKECKEFSFDSVSLQSSDGVFSQSQHSIESCDLGKSCDTIKSCDSQNSQSDCRNTLCDINTECHEVKETFVTELTRGPLELPQIKPAPLLVSECSHLSQLESSIKSHDQIKQSEVNPATLLRSECKHRPEHLAIRNDNKENVCRNSSCAGTASTSNSGCTRPSCTSGAVSPVVSPGLQKDLKKRSTTTTTTNNGRRFSVHLHICA